MSKKDKFESTHKKFRDLEEDDESGDTTQTGTHEKKPSYEELVKKLDDTEKQATQHWERILRMQADNENIARRNERDIANAHKYALEKFVNELLPIIDSLELSVTNVPDNLKEAASSIIEGIDLTLKMFYTALEKFGVKQVNPLNQPFNPEFEQAIAVQPSTTVPPGTVVSVLQKGYTLNNRLIRPALVTVSQAPE